MKPYEKGHAEGLLRFFSIIIGLASLLVGVMLSFETVNIGMYSTIERQVFSPIGLGIALSGLTTATALWGAAGAIELLKFIASNMDATNAKPETPSPTETQG